MPLTDRIPTRLPQQLFESLRGLAGHARSVAGPAVQRVVSGTTDQVARRLPGYRPLDEDAQPAASVTEDSTPTQERENTEQDTSGRTPTPASVARNVSGPRPTAKKPAGRKPTSAPGAKLPVRRTPAAENP